MSLQVCVVAEGTSPPREEYGGPVKCPVRYPMRGRRKERRRGGGKLEDKVCFLHPYMTSTHLHSHTPHPHTPPHTSLPLHPHNPHLIRRWLMFWSGEVHGDSPLYILVGRRLPLALPCDHMVVVHFTLWVSGCAPVPGEV